MTKEQRIALLEEILAIDSSAGNEKAVADCLQKHLKKSGVRSKQVAYAPGRSNLVAELGGARAGACLFGAYGCGAAGGYPALGQPAVYAYGAAGQAVRAGRDGYEGRACRHGCRDDGAGG